jgi:hypothetical protein
MGNGSGGEEGVMSPILFIFIFGSRKNSEWGEIFSFQC